MRAVKGTVVRKNSVLIETGEVIQANTAGFLKGARVYVDYNLKHPQKSIVVKLDEERYEKYFSRPKPTMRQLNGAKQQQGSTAQRRNIMAGSRFGKQETMITGRLGADPTLVLGKRADEKCRLLIHVVVTPRPWKDRETGEKRDIEGEPFLCTLWGRERVPQPNDRVESAAKWLAKGTVVSMKLRFNSYVHPLTYPDGSPIVYEGQQLNTKRWSWTIQGGIEYGESSEAQVQSEIVEGIRLPMWNGNLSKEVLEYFNEKNPNMIMTPAGLLREAEKGRAAWAAYMEKKKAAHYKGEEVFFSTKVLNPEAWAAATTGSPNHEHASDGGFGNLGGFGSSPGHQAGQVAGSTPHLGGFGSGGHEGTGTQSKAPYHQNIDGQLVI